MEAIILAGGFGTRLKKVVPDVPKPMAPIQGRPFLEYVLCYLKRAGVKRVVLSVCHQCEVIQDYFRDEFDGIAIDYSIEEETNPLGTGGAIKKSLEFCDVSNVVVVNGDTFFNVNLSELLTCHQQKDSVLTLALKPMKYFDRYGAVSIDAHQKIISLEEKQYRESGLINGGVYAVNKKIFSGHDLIDTFSFEQFMQEKHKHADFYGYISDEYFIDIGIPEDYKTANETVLNQEE